jgi:hypothetical protein
MNSSYLPFCSDPLRHAFVYLQDKQAVQLRRKYLAQTDTAQDLHQNNVLENPRFSPKSKINKI